MTAVLAWLLALPAQVLRLVRTLVDGIAQFRARRTAPHARTIAELRRRYPDAPRVWLEVVARNMPTAPEPAKHSPVPDPSGAQDDDLPALAPPASASAPWVRKPVGELPVQERDLPAAPRSLPTVSVEAAPARRQPGGSRPEWRNPGAVALPIEPPVRDSRPAIRAPGFRGLEQPKVSVRSQLAAAPELAAIPAGWDLPVEEPEAEARTEWNGFAPDREDDPWPALPAEAPAKAAAYSPAHVHVPNLQPWRDPPGADQWPALLPARHRTGERSVSLAARIARLRAIQERL